MDRVIAALRRDSPRELPFVWLRSASVLRGIDMSPAELSAWLRAADLLASQDPGALP